MAWNFSYKKMLERAYKKLPEKIQRESRFEIPKITSRVQGNRTIVRNFGKLAKDISRSKDHLMKFLLRELATTGKEERNSVVFIGKFSNDILQRKFKKYIEEFVLCAQCGKPDTELIKEKGLTFKRCEACGAKSSVRNIK